MVAVAEQRPHSASRTQAALVAYTDARTALRAAERAVEDAGGEEWRVRGTLPLFAAFCEAQDALTDACADELPALLAIARAARWVCDEGRWTLRDDGGWQGAEAFPCADDLDALKEALAALDRAGGGGTE